MPAHGYARVSPRCFLLLPWTAAVDPERFRNIAEVIWRFDLADGELLPLSAWYGAGGAGIGLGLLPECTPGYRAQVEQAVQRWEQETGRRVWFLDTA
jgi:hypothetical protein